MTFISNNGKDIVGTDFFHNKPESFFVSVNAGSFRLLLPKELEYAIKEMRTGKFAIVSMNNSWFEILFENMSDSPFAIHSPIAAIDRIPSEERRDNLILSVWIAPCKKVLEIPCKFRKVVQIPNMQPWK